MEKVKQKIEVAYPGIDVQFVIRETRGDQLQDIPLQTVEGSDFFTRDIFNDLSNGEVDIAVHSLKDLSSEHFFGENKFAVVDRDDTRDVAVFNCAIENKIQQGEAIVMGTCSPRRELMATGFLKKALPQLKGEINIVTRPIRGNVETRLRKLNGGEYDGTILATAGLNRLLNPISNSSLPGETVKEVRELLADKKLILLPLVECVPAPCQGAIVAEAHYSNKKAVDILEKINNIALMNTCVREKQIAKQYGVGCLQEFGVTTIAYGNCESIYSGGKDSCGNHFSNWTGLPGLTMKSKKLFSSTDLMGKFFNYDYTFNSPEIKEQVVYVANYKAVEQQSTIEILGRKRVWASGTKTWLEMAKRGIWVEGSADAFGLEFLEKAWKMPLFEISKADVAVLTNEQSMDTWKNKGWNTYASYRLVENYSAVIAEHLKQADLVFWTSFRQYTLYKEILKKEVQHSCPFGETSEQLKAAGISPVIFPNIKAFMQWRQISIH